jgi:hypothetical protein
VKRSRHVVLLITGSVLLTACSQEQDQGRGYSGEFGTNNGIGTNSAGYAAPGRTVVHHSPMIYPWYHPYRYFSSGSSSSRSGLSSSGQSRSGSSSGASAAPARGGFGSHSSSSS